jgi:hypothetical protein
MQPPESGEPGRGNRVAECIRGASEHCRRLVEVVLQEPRLSERGADREVVFPGEDGRTQEGCEDLHGLRTTTPFECAARAREQGVQGGGSHRTQYTFGFNPSFALDDPPVPAGALDQAFGFGRSPLSGPVGRLCP